MVRVRDAIKDEEDWIDYDLKAQKDLGDYYVKQAEKFNEIFTAVYAIYTGLLLLFGLMNGEILKMLAWPVALCFLLPVLGWVAGIFCFFLVLQPDIQKMPPNSPTAIRKSLYASNVKKAGFYSIGLLAFGIGVMLMVVSLGIGSYYASLPADTGDVQLVIRGDAVQYISQIPIDLVPGANKTVIVSLRNITDSSYSVRLANGDTVDLDKSWIQTVIRKTK